MSAAMVKYRKAVEAGTSAIDKKKKALIDYESKLQTATNRQKELAGKTQVDDKVYAAQKQALEQLNTEIEEQGRLLKEAQKANESRMESMNRSTPDKRTKEYKNLVVQQERLKTLTEQQATAQTNLDNTISKSQYKAQLTRAVESQNKWTKSIEQTQQEIQELGDGGASKAFKELLKDLESLELEPDTIKSLEDLESIMRSIARVSQNQLVIAMGNVEKEVKDADNAAEGLNNTLRDSKSVVDDFTNSAQEIDNLKSSILQFFSIGNAVQLFKNAVRSAFETVKELDATMTEAAVVTEFSVGDMWEKLPEYSDEASKLGARINDLYGATTLYYQQGLKTNEAMGVGVETMKMARIANMDATAATTAMTAALRGFNMEVNEMNAQTVNDVYSELAAITAADTSQIATAMSKTASIAASANMEFENTAALLAQIIETTQEAPETAGTALKTIIARFSEVKKLANEGQNTGEDEEGEAIDVNKIQTALRTVGISMDDFFKGTEGLDDVLMSLAEKWDTLDFETQRYIATTAAGSRQQSRFIAMMSDYERTVELTNAANNSAGASTEQFNKTLDSLDSKLNELKNAWDTFIMGLANQELLKDAVDVLTWIISALNNIVDFFSGESGLAKTLNSVLLIIGALKIGKAGFDKLFNKLDIAKNIKEGIKEGLRGADEKVEKQTEKGIENGVQAAYRTLVDSFRRAAKEGTEAGVQEGSGNSVSVNNNFDNNNQKSQSNTNVPLTKRQATTNFLKELQHYGSFEKTGLKGTLSGLGKFFSSGTGSMVAGATLSVSSRLNDFVIKSWADSIETSGEKLKGMNAALDETNQDISHLGTILDGLDQNEKQYKDLTSSLKMMQKGSKEYNKSLRESNEVARELIFSDIGQQIKNGYTFEDGQYKLSDNFFEEYERLSELELYRLESQKSGLQASIATEEFNTNLTDTAKTNEISDSEQESMINTSAAVGVGTAIAGMAIGAAIGSSVPIIGTIIGGLVGGLLGAVGAFGVGSIAAQSGADQEELQRGLSEFGASGVKISQEQVEAINEGANAANLVEEEDKELVAFIEDYNKIWGENAFENLIRESDLTAEEINKLGAAALNAKNAFEIEQSNALYNLAKNQGYSEETANAIAQAGQNFLSQPVKSEKIEEYKTGFEALETDEQNKWIEQQLGEGYELRGNQIVADGQVVDEVVRQDIYDKAAAAYAEEQVNNWIIDQIVVEGSIEGEEGNKTAEIKDTSESGWRDQSQLERATSGVGKHILTQHGGNVSQVREEALRSQWSSLDNVGALRNANNILSSFPDIQKGIITEGITDETAKALKEASETGFLTAETFEKAGIENGEQILKTLQEAETNEERVAALETLGADQVLELNSLIFDRADEVKHSANLDAGVIGVSEEDFELLKSGGYSIEEMTALANTAETLGTTITGLAQIAGGEIGDFTEFYNTILPAYLNDLEEKLGNYDSEDGEKLNNYSNIATDRLTSEINSQSEAAQGRLLDIFSTIGGSEEFNNLSDDNKKKVEAALSVLDLDDYEQLKEFEGLMKDLGIEGFNADDVAALTGAIYELGEASKSAIADLNTAIESLNKFQPLSKDLIDKLKETNPDIEGYFIEVNGQYYLKSGVSAETALGTGNIQSQLDASQIGIDFGSKFEDDSGINLTYDEVIQNWQDNYSRRGLLGEKDANGDIITQDVLDQWAKSRADDYARLQLERLGIYTQEQIDSMDSETLKEVYEDYLTKYGKENYQTNIENRQGALIASADTDYLLDNKVDSEAAEGTLIAQANAKGLDVEAVVQYKNHIRDLYNLSETSAARIAANNALQNQGMEELSAGWAEWSEQIKTADRDSLSYSSAVNNLRKTADKLLGTTEDLSDEWLTNEKNMELFEKAANGDTEALVELQKSAAKEIAFGVDFDKDLTPEQEALNAAIDAFEPDDIEIGASLDSAGLTDVFNALITSGQMTADQVNAALESIGFEPELTYQEVPVEDVNYSQTTGTAEVINPITGEKETVTANNIANFAQNGMVRIPVINGSTTKFSGSPSSTIDTPKIKEGGGGGGKKKPEKQHWENPYDELHNTQEALDETLRDRNQLEIDYDRILKDRTKTFKDLYKNQQAQLKNLEREKQLQNELLAGRKAQLASLASEFYIATRRNGDEEEQFRTTFAKEFKRLGLGSIDNYMGYDQKTGELWIDWERIEAIERNEKTGEDQGALIEALKDRYDEIAGQIEETEDALYEIEDRVAELLDQGREEYEDLEQQVYDAIVNERQTLIDNYSTLSETLSESSSNMLTALQESIDLERQIRDNTKQEEDIAEMEARLAYLRADTSGGNRLQILELEEQLAEARESYGDTLIDQEIERLNHANEEAVEQRERQIEIMQSQLDYQQETGYFWEQAYDLIDAMFNEDFSLNLDSETVRLLQANSDWKAMSEQQRDTWAGELIQSVNQGFAWLAGEGSSRQLEKIGITSGNITFTNAKGQVVEGVVNEDGSVTAKDGSVYHDVFQSFGGKYMTAEETGEIKETSTPSTPSAPKPEETFPYGKASETTGILQQGSRGKQVKAVQYALNKLNYGNAGTTSVDGEYGGGTVSAVRKFQRDMGIGVDGMVGNETRKKFALNQYKTGGLADFTGPAWLDGTKSHPELILNQQDTKNFIVLKDILADALSAMSGKTSAQGGDNYFDIDIIVDEISSDYDVDQLSERIKQNIYEDGMYRNVNTISLQR